MHSQPASNDIRTHCCTIYTNPVLLTDDGIALPNFTPSYPRGFTQAQIGEHVVKFPGQPAFHVTPGYISEIDVDQVPDGCRPTGTTSFDFSIRYPACNGLRQTDGREICEAVKRLVARMVADRTWRRREFGGRDDEAARGQGEQRVGKVEGKTHEKGQQQQQGPGTATGEQKPEASAPGGMETAEQVVTKG